MTGITMFILGMVIGSVMMFIIINGSVKKAMHDEYKKFTGKIRIYCDHVSKLKDNIDERDKQGYMKAVADILDLYREDVLS